MIDLSPASWPLSSLSLQDKLKALASSPEDARVWIQIAEAFKPEDGVRTMLAHALTKTVQRHAPQSLRQFELVASQLPQRSGFSFMPMDEAVLLALCATRLIHPEKTLCEGFDAFMMQACKDLFETPVFQILLRAVHGRLDDFLELSLSQNSFSNYQEQALRRMDKQHYELHIELSYPAWDERVNIPYLRGLFAHFGVQGEARFKARSERASTIFISWS